MALESVLKCVKVVISLSTFFCIFFTTVKLTHFLSVPKEIISTKEDPWLTSSRALLVDMALLSLFILQHSSMASDRFKDLLNRLGLHDMSRSIYNTGTAAALWVVIQYWEMTPQVVIWDLNLNYKPIWYLYIGIHATAWTIVYVANVCTDLTELLGLKQVFYSVNNLPDPKYRKSEQLRRLTSHMRHPSFLGFLMILWFFPLMTLDRVLMSTILSCFMYIAWNTDGEDYHYQKYMYDRKYFELKKLASE